MSFDLTQFILNNKNSFHDVLDLIPIPIFAKGIDGKYITCNEAYEEISGKSREEMIGKDAYDLWPNHQADLFYEKDKELFDNPGLQEYQTDISASFGKPCIVKFHKATFDDSNGQVVGLLGVIFDITEKVKLEEKLRKLSEIDDLTGLINRRTGRNLIEQVFNQNKRNKGDMVIAMFDIDNFKVINDNYGHDVGDKVLTKVKSITSKALRDYDIILRHGGEEFIICFPETNLVDALIVLERIRMLFENEFIPVQKDQNIFVTVSVGVAAYLQHGTTIEELVNASDKAMYKAKKSGRNCIEIALPAQ